MKFSISRILCTLAGLTAVLGSQPTLADDSEVFTSTIFTTGAGARPNVLFIIDTSGSMDSEVVTYDPAVTYTGLCSAAFVYWGTANTAVPPDCVTTTNKLTLANNRCRAAYNGMQANGWYNGRTQVLNAAATSWENLASGVDRKVECEADRGNHGDTIASSGGSGSNLYARNGSGTNRWGNSSSNNQVSWNGKPRISYYNANYINWYYGGGTGSRKTRMDIVKQVATNMINTLQNVNLGLMRYSNNDTGSEENQAQGGMVVYPVVQLTDDSRVEMAQVVADMKPAGWTPLSETFFEAHQYLSGSKVAFGVNSMIDRNTAQPSVAGSRVGNNINSDTYESPMDFSCQKSFIVYLTDGLPTQDTQANDAIKGLLAASPDTDGDGVKDGYVATDDGGGGDTCPAEGPSGGAHGACMVNLAGYMQNHDMRSNVTGNQNVTTYVVGFGDDIAESADYLEDIANAGGGKSYTQNDAAGLTAALEEIFAEVASDANSTFVSPTVAINAFNRTRNLNTLFVSVFAPTKRAHWPGNVKKYQLIDGVIHGASTTQPAVNPDTGFFADGTSDMFNNTGTADGADVTKGGAAVRLPAWDARKVYTHLGTSADLTADVNKFRVLNTGITNAMLGLSTTSTRRTDVMEFTLGKDVNDDDADTNFTETRHAMGDPMHSRPAVAIYSGTEEDPVGTVYATTNDGMLQALDMTTGVELWSFIPREMMLRLSTLQRDLVTTSRNYGLDGDVRVLKYDVDGDGIIETGDGDKMYAVVGFGRGGAGYYGLDITSRTAPRFLWKKTNADLPMLGQAWSTPVITRVNVNSTAQTDAQKFVAIFGAGYDTSQEGYSYTTDGVGNGVYMLELKTGNLLWSAGKTDSGANWQHPFMNNSIPADITVLDMNGDSFADRMYFGDMGGRIWRLDIWHGQAPANLVSGGLMATLGAGHLATPTDQDARRFYYAPDVSVVTPRGSAPYLNIAIGSGYRGHPLDEEIRDRFYSIRDYQPFNRRTNTSFNSPWTPIEDDDLVDVTTDITEPVVDGANGWKINMVEDGTNWRGEKVLAESVTVNGVIFFPSFTPTGVDPENPCLAATLNRTWAVFLDSGRPFGLRDAVDPDDPDDHTNVDDPDDRYTDDPQGGIAPGTSVVQTEGETICLKGVATHKCVEIGDVTRTFWERRK